MNIETNSGLDMQQQSFQWDAADKDAAKGANMKYQAQKKNNAQIKKMVDRNSGPATNQTSSRFNKQKTTQQQNLKQKNQMEAQKNLRQGPNPASNRFDSNKKRGAYATLNSLN